jgi:hypothetical protein
LGTLLFLDPPHVGDDRRPSIQQTEDRVIDLVDPIAQRLQRFVYAVHPLHSPEHGAEISPESATS